MKRFLCGLLCLVLLAGILPVLAEEEDDQLSQEELDAERAELEQLDAEDDSIYEVTGKVYPEPTLKDFNSSSPAIYTGIIGGKYSIYSQMDTDSKKVQSSNGSSRGVDILYVGLKWLIVRTKDNKIGYAKREWFVLTDIKTVDPVNTPPFNCQKHAYIATTATTCHVRKTMDPYNPAVEDDGNNWVVLKPGTKITIWQFYDGWAMVNYMRSYGYIDPNELTDLKPVSPTDEVLYDDCPIAAYTSYYKMVQTEINLNRIHNIKLGCQYISIVVQPGQEFNANKIMGRYNASKGYRKAGVLVEGTTTPGYGGGTCQVSSTLYNVLVQLPKIQIKQRRAHGGSGASYLPIHCDAAVGNAELNLRFVNGYDFPIRIEACSNDDGALSIRIYRADSTT
ncbi:MAG: VanW family protein [Clostridiales bacterium]|nr:VanW family protein [Clostridiales bacterium]